MDYVSNFYSQFMSAIKEMQFILALEKKDATNQERWRVGVGEIAAKVG